MGGSLLLAVLVCCAIKARAIFKNRQALRCAGILRFHTLVGIAKVILNDGDCTLGAYHERCIQDAGSKGPTLRE